MIKDGESVDDDDDDDDNGRLHDSDDNGKRCGSTDVLVDQSECPLF